MSKLIKNKLPEFTIIICNFNHAKWIERCLRSISHQTNINDDLFEVILIDDKSTDNSLDIIKNISLNLDIRIIKNQKNIGLPSSLNKAIKLSLGRYIVRVDSDDYIARNFLYLSRLFLNYNREYDAVASDYIKVDSNEKVISKHNALEEEIACGITFRKESLFNIGLYDETFKMREGHNLRIRFEEKYKIGRLEFPLYKYRSHESNRTLNKKELLKFDKKLNEKK